MRSALAFVAFLAVLGLPPAEADPLADAASALAKHSDGFGIDAGGGPVLQALWDRATGDALDYLNRHPGTAPERLDTAFSRRDMTITAKTIGPDLVGLSLFFGEVGDVLVLARTAGRYRVVWDAATLGQGDTARFAALKAWSIGAAAETCRARTKDEDWGRCGPIHGDFMALPPDGRGAIRFAISATYAQMAGETVGGQISLWSWDGTRATPLLAKTYAYMIEQSAFVSLAGDVLTVREKKDFKTFFSCGACEGRQVA